MPFVTSWIGPFALRSSSLDREQGARSISGRVGLEVMEATPAGWRPYEHGPRSTVVGRLLVSDPLGAPSLGRTIELLAWIPEGPVPLGGSVAMYMHDGANLFDDEGSYAGEWKVDETLTTMGSTAVVIGVPNAGDRRAIEYCPWPSPLEPNVLGPEYARWLVDVAKPFCEGTLPISRARNRTCVMGSSLGGVISLYLFLEYPDQFGRVGSMSTAAWWTPDIWPYLDTVEVRHGKVYIDTGTAEVPEDPVVSEAYVDTFHRLRSWFVAAGYGDDLLAVVEDGAIHSESAWTPRLRPALEFLLA
jgi:predicted alpha/beta superfamily hydrolase